VVSSRRFPTLSCREFKKSRETTTSAWHPQLENFEKLFRIQRRDKSVIIPNRIQSGSPNKMYAARHFHMKKYNCVIVTSVKAFGFGAGAG